MYGKAIQAMERFFVVGIMEEFNTSGHHNYIVFMSKRNMNKNAKLCHNVVELAFTRLQASRIPKSEEIPRERLAAQKRQHRKEVILSNSDLIKRAAINNLYDIQLYRFGVSRFCKHAKNYPEVNVVHSIPYLLLTSATSIYFYAFL